MSNQINLTMMKKFFLLAWAVIAALSFSSCSKDDDGNNDNSEPILSATVHIEQEGTLKNVLQEKKLLDVYSIGSTFNVVSLKITGVLGEDDWEVFSGSIDPLQTLQNLDLSEVTTTSIPKKIFWGTSLHSLILPNKLVTIEEGAFAYCKLTSIKIPASVETIEEDAFTGSSLQSITFEKGSKLKTIGEFALRQTALTSIEIPASVETIEEGAISDCSSLPTITFEKGSKLKTIGEFAFQGTALTSIEIPASVETIGENAISVCSSLSTVTFEKGSKLKTIGKGAFFDSALTSIEIPASVETIGERAFTSTENVDSKLVAISFEQGSKLKTIEEGAFFYSALTSIEIPASVETIGESAIAACSSLSTITFEKGSKLKTIGSDAFFSCTNLKTFDASYCRWLNSIGSGVFFQCNSLQVIKIGTATPPEVFGAFGIDRFPILKVPSESVEAYKNADGWMDFPNISALY